MVTQAVKYGSYAAGPILCWIAQLLLIFTDVVHIQPHLQLHFLLLPFYALVCFILSLFNPVVHPGGSDKIHNGGPVC